MESVKASTIGICTRKRPYGIPYPHVQTRCRVDAFTFSVAISGFPAGRRVVGALACTGIYTASRVDISR